MEPTAVSRGLRNARLSGRMERRELGGVEWVFDVAHNPAAADALASELERLPVPGRTFAVLAVMGDKDYAGVLTPLQPLVDRWLVTCAGGDRGAKPDALVAALEEGTVSSVCLDVAAACEQAQLAAEPGDRVIVYGSFYLVGPAMSALGLYSAPAQPGDRSAKWTGV